jgi:hypothetical protein
MPALNFKQQFSSDVRTGKKRQTIRALGKRSFRPGVTLYHYTGQRTARCRLLATATCQDVKPVVIHRDTVTLDGERLIGDALRAFAIADGFWSVREFFDFFEKQHFSHIEPFHGRVIYW